MECVNCGEDFEELTETIDGGVCDECLNNYTECAYCGEYVNTANTTETLDGDVCNNCINEYTECNYCGGLIQTQDSYDTEDGDVCEYCYENNYAECECCGTVTTDYTYSEYSDRTLCSRCYEEEEEELENKVIKSYHEYRSSNYVPHKVEDECDSLYMGFELEMGDCDYAGDVEIACSNALSYFGDNMFHFEEDGSIPDYGAEMISQPCTLQYHKMYDWCKVLKHFASNGLKSHDASGCGLHIHVNRNYFTNDYEGELKWTKIDVFVQMQREFIEKFSRRTSNYYYSYVDITDKEGKEIVDECKNNKHSRYRSLNFNNDKTVEFRMFRGTLNYNTFMATLQFVHAVVNWCPSESTINILNKEKALNLFIGYITEHEEIYKELNDYLKTKFENLF